MKKKLLFAVVVCLTLVGAMLTGTKNTYAEAAAVKISPVANAINIKAGQSQNYQFTLENMSQKDYKFKLYTAPYNVVNEDYDADFTNETNYNQSPAGLPSRTTLAPSSKTPCTRLRREKSAPSSTAFLSHPTSQRAANTA